MPSYNSAGSSAVAYELVIERVEDSRFRRLYRARTGRDLKAEYEKERDAVLDGRMSYFDSVFHGWASAITVTFDTGKTYSYPADDDLIRAAENQSGLVSLIWSKYRRTGASTAPSRPPYTAEARRRSVAGRRAARRFIRRNR